MEKHLKRIVCIFEDLPYRYRIQLCPFPLSLSSSIDDSIYGVTIRPFVTSASYFIPSAGRMVKIDDGKSARFHYKRPNKGRGNLLLSYLSIFHSVILILAHMACKSFHIASWSLRAQELNVV